MYSNRIETRKSKSGGKRNGYIIAPVPSSLKARNASDFIPFFIPLSHAHRTLYWLISEHGKVVGLFWAKIISGVYELNFGGVRWTIPQTLRADFDPREIIMRDALEVRA